MTRLEDLPEGQQARDPHALGVQTANLKSLYVGEPAHVHPGRVDVRESRTLWIAECRLVALPLFLAVALLANFYCERPAQAAPEVYERGGNDEVLRYLRSVAETERERRDMERLRKELEATRRQSRRESGQEHEREKREKQPGRRAPRRIPSARESTKSVPRVPRMPTKEAKEETEREATKETVSEPARSLVSPPERRVSASSGRRLLRRRIFGRMARDFVLAPLVQDAIFVRRRERERISVSKRSTIARVFLLVRR